MPDISLWIINISLHAFLFFRSQNRFQENPDSYNGAVRENYSWSQDYSDVEVRVFVPKTISKGRQVNIHENIHPPDMLEILFLFPHSVV